jgi:FdhE protein
MSLPTERLEAQRERAEPRDLAALTALAAAHPELAPAVALERELMDGERRLQRRLGTAWLSTTNEELAARLAAGRPLVDWGQVAIDWSELRLRLRQVVDVLRRHDVVEAAEAARLQALTRDAELPALVQHWFEHPAAPSDHSLADVLTLTVRPFLIRVVEVVQQRVSTEGWAHGTCPMCGGRPVFGALPASGPRQLVCGRCFGRWVVDTRTCPHCLQSDRVQVFSAHDGVYQVAACEGCRRYVKAIDVRRAGRPLFLPVDTVATLALDQAVTARGYLSE